MIARSLPLDLWVKILSFSDLVTIVCCQQSCRALYDLVNETAELVYLKEAFLRGYQPLRATGSVSIMELRESLIQQDKSWNQLHFRVLSTTDLPTDAWCHTAHVCGDYAVCRMFPVTGSALYRVHIPTSEVTAFTLLNAPGNWLDIVVSEGLVAQISFSDERRGVTLSIRTLSDLVRPPACGADHLVIAVPKLQPTNISSFGICGPHAVIIAERTSRDSWERQVVVYDWTRGLEMCLPNDDATLPAMATFVNLDLLAVIDNSAKTLAFYDVTSEGGISCTAVLALPDRTSEFLIMPKISQVSTAPGRVLHKADPESGLLVVELTPRSTDSAIELLVLKRAALPSLKQRYSSRSEETPIPWSAWGPNFATVLPIGDVSGIMMHQSRILCGEPHPDGKYGTEVFKLFDFGRNTSRFRVSTIHSSLLSDLFLEEEGFESYLQCQADPETGCIFVIVSDTLPHGGWKARLIVLEPVTSGSLSS